MRYEGEHGGSEIVIEYLADELDKTQRKVDPVEEHERRWHSKSRREYEEAYAPHRESLRLWQAEAGKIRARREAEAWRGESVARVRQKVKRAFGSKRDSDPDRIGALSWELAAPGESTDDHVRWYYREVLGRGRLEGFSQDRLDKMLALPRSNWKKGTAGKYGYIVLMFAHTEKVLLECPIYGNAIFVLDSGEDRLLKMNKQELRASHEVKTIIHVGGWYGRVKKQLEIE